MPISDPEWYDKGHFRNVYEDLIKVACEKAGFKAVRADDVKQTNLIHLDVIQKLIESPMAICDLSNRNPNVLFELWLRQAFDKPTVLIQECWTEKIFDISPLRITDYRRELKYKEVLQDQDAIAQTILDTKTATDKWEWVNSIISILSLGNPASLKEPWADDSAKMLQVVMAEMSELRYDFRQVSRKFDERDAHIPDRMIEFDKIKIETYKLQDLIRSKAPLPAVKEYYDFVRNRVFRYLDRPVSPVRREKLQTILQELDESFSNYVAFSDGVQRIE
jgi:hypothetical protein